jgi:CRP/FNR family transcriptional regulator
MDNSTRCETCAIRSKAVCAALSGAELQDINRISSRKTLKKGQTVFPEGEPPTVFGNIVSGVVKLTKSLDDGRQHIIGLLFPSDFVGRAYRHDNPYYAEAATDVELCVFPTSSFERILQRHPTLERRLFEFALSELDACQEWMLLLARKTAAEKVATFLLMVSRRAANSGCAHTTPGNGILIDLPLSRSEIADCLGLTIETVSRQITRLKTAKVIELVNYREIHIVDPALLRQAAHDAAH